jgi:hypothetical protein
MVLIKKGVFERTGLVNKKVNYQGGDKENIQEYRYIFVLEMRDE